jgi:murein DD-endopeptidase MepM/ murein hydrolase activator NlpD
MLSSQTKETIKIPLADGFDYPVGKPHAEGYYVFRGYWPNGHLGEDWNGNGGGNTDLGDPVYAIADGIAVYSSDYGMGWGNVIILRHAYRDGQGRVMYIDSLYGHLDRRDARMDQIVKRGQQIGTIGTAHGKYYAHLHFEIRKNLQIGMKRSSFKKDHSCYHNPRTFIRNHRQLRPERRWQLVAVNTFGSSQPLSNVGATPKPVNIPTRQVDKKRVLDEALERIMEANRKIPEVTDEEMDTFWSKLKGKLKRGR